MTEVFLSATELNYSYRALPVLHSISWQWLAGQQWACLGPNGCGKTTLAKLISSQLRLTSGEIARADNLQAVAYVCFEQQQALCARDDRFDDSEMRADAHDPGTTVQSAILGSANADDEFRQWSTRLRITHILDRGIRFISTGEMRKTLLLKAILSRPDLLILDSPLDGLDIQSQAEMSQLIEDLLSSPLRVLLLSRQAEDLPAAVSHILALNEGRVVSAGPRQQVLADAQVHALLYPPATELGELPPPGQRAYAVPEDQPLLQLQGVNVSYDGTQVLREVDWTFDHGQHCCVSGPNGCGKTTLLSLVTGDNHKAYGQHIVLFGQRRGSGESVWDIKQKYGVVDTRLHLNFARGMKALEVVISGFFDTVGLYDDWGDQQRQTASEWLSALGLAEYERVSFDGLSFGIQRMVLLARAMVKSPLILILDEPCLGLDGPHRATILAAIDHIAANSDTQVIYVSHSAGEMPDCINQQVAFTPVSDGFRVTTSQADA